MKKQRMKTRKTSNDAARLSAAELNCARFTNLIRQPW